MGFLDKLLNRRKPTEPKNLELTKNAAGPAEGDIKLELERKYGHFWLGWFEFPSGGSQIIQIKWVDGPTKNEIKDRLLRSRQWGIKIIPDLIRLQSQKSKGAFGDSPEGFEKWRSTSLPILSCEDMLKEREIIASAFTKIDETTAGIADKINAKNEDSKEDGNLTNARPPGFERTGSKEREIHAPKERGKEPFRKGQLITVVLGVVTKDCDIGSRGVFNFAFIESTEIQRNVYRVLVKALYQSLEGVKPGVPLQLIDSIARNTITKSGYGNCGYWNYSEPLMWYVSGSRKWEKAVSLSGMVLFPGMVLNIEPSIKMPQLNAFVMTLSGNETWYDDDIVKVGATIAVTQDGYELIGERPPEVLKVTEQQSAP